MGCHMYTAKTSIKGQIVIPKPLRDRLGIKPGTTVELIPEQGRLQLRALPDDPITAIRGSLKGGPSLAKQLMREHREDVRRARRRA